MKHQGLLPSNLPDNWVVAKDIITALSDKQHFLDIFPAMLAGQDDSNDRAFVNSWLCVKCVRELVERHFWSWLVRWKITRTYFLTMLCPSD